MITKTEIDNAICHNGLWLIVEPGDYKFSDGFFYGDGSVMRTGHLDGVVGEIFNNAEYNIGWRKVGEGHYEDSSGRWMKKYNKKRS